MTNRADQNWPEEMTYELTVERDRIQPVVLTTDYDLLLDRDHSLGAVVESTERTVTALMTLVDEVMQ